MYTGLACEENRFSKMELDFKVVHNFGPNEGVHVTFKQSEKLI